MNLYVWYSAATDVTGKALMEKLNATGGLSEPKDANVPVLCWGTKTDKDVNIASKNVYNHPNKIRQNRNKYEALRVLSGDPAVAVAAFTNDSGKVGTKGFEYPVVARKSFHQGGAGFWTCLNKIHLAQAVKEGAQYFQKYINVNNEYRLHVAGGEVIYAVKKVPRDNLKEAFVAHYSDYVKASAGKAVNAALKLDAATMDFVLNKLAGKMAATTDMIIRSNTRGWKFSSVQLANLPAELKEMAKKCVKTLGLDFGAVDCCIDDNGKAFIIECNSGPGLEGSSMDAWVGVIEKMVTPPAKVAVKAAPKKDEVVPVGINVPKGKAAGKTKEALKASLSMMSALLDAADDDQAEVLNVLFAKVTGK